MRFLIFLLFCILQNFAIQSSDYNEQNTNIFRLGRIYSNGINISSSYLSDISSGDFSFSSNGHLLWSSESHYKYFRNVSYSGIINTHLQKDLNEKHKDSGIINSHLQKVKFSGRIYALKFLLPLPLSNKVENYIGSVAISTTIGTGLGIFYLQDEAVSKKSQGPNNTKANLGLDITKFFSIEELLSSVEGVKKYLERSYLSMPGMASVGIEYRPIDFIGLQASYNFYVVKTIISTIDSKNLFWLDNSWSIGAVISF